MVVSCMNLLDPYKHILLFLFFPWLTFICDFYICFVVDVICPQLLTNYSINVFDVFNYVFTRSMFSSLIFVNLWTCMSFLVSCYLECIRFINFVWCKLPFTHVILVFHSYAFLIRIANFVMKIFHLMPKLRYATWALSYVVHFPIIYAFIIFWIFVELISILVSRVTYLTLVVGLISSWNVCIFVCITYNLLYLSFYWQTFIVTKYSIFL